MNSYKINYKQLRQQPELSEMLNALQRGLDRFGIDFFLVGAVARDVWLNGINNIVPKRTTGDIDFAVLINDKGTYDMLKDYLIHTEGFAPYRENAFVLIWKDKMEVDLLPFGGIENEQSKVITEGVGLTSISLQGFQEVYDEGLPELNLEGKHQFKFCTLPGIVLLKLIAWDDRPEQRRDDIKDISDILNHYFAMYDNTIWQNHGDLFNNDYIDTLHTACRVMGRELSTIASRNQILYNRIQNILHQQSEDVTKSKMAIIMREYFGDTVEDNVMLLRQLQQGFLESNHRL